MSAPQLGLLNASLLKLIAETESEPPDPPGPQVTPNTLQRQLYRARNKANEIKTLLEEITESQQKITETINRATGATRDAKEQAYITYCNNAQLEGKITVAIRKRKAWEERTQLLEDRLDIAPLSTTVSSGTATPQANQRKTRAQYPPIQIKRFSGKMDDWIPFWETYRVLVHEEDTMDKVEKFNILESHLDGMAKEIIAGLQITERGYDDAIDLLLNKYGDSRKLIRALNHEIMSLETSENVDADEKLQLQIEKICRKLAALNQNIEGAAYYMPLEGKLSPAVLDKYFIIKDSEDANNWDMSKFRDALGRAINQIKNREEAKFIAEKTTSSLVRKDDSGKSEPTMNFAVNFKERKENKREERRNPNFKSEYRSPSPQRKREFKGSTNRERSSSDNSTRERGRQWERKNRGGRNWKGSPYPRERWSSRSTSPNSSRSQSRSTSRSGSRTKYPCYFCGSPHSPVFCDRFKTADERRSRALRKELCLRCLGKGHFASACQRRKRACMFCKSMGHHSAFCRRKKNDQRNAAPKESNSAITESCSKDEKEKQEISAATCLADSQNKMSVLKCVYVNIYNPTEPHLNKDVLAFLDDGSQKTYINKELAQELNLKEGTKQKFELTGLGGVSLGKFQVPLVEFGIRQRRFDMLMKGRSIEKIMNELPILEHQNISNELLKRTKLTIPHIYDEPKLTIGGDYYNHVGVIPIEQLPSGFFVCKSKLGKIICGEGKIRFLTTNTDMEEKVGLSISKQKGKEQIEAEIMEEYQNQDETNLTELVRQHDGLNAIGLGDASIEDKDILEAMQQKISFNGERYQTELLWIEEKADKLPTNYDVAHCQLMSLLQRLKDKPEALKAYHDKIFEQVKMGYVEETDPLEDDKKIVLGQKIHYLCHHAVFKDTSVHTQLRIVYNASLKRKGAPALNECLEKGVNLYNDLGGIQLRSRLKKFLIAWDIAKAFHQIELHPKDRDCVRFLWVKNPFEENSPIIHYRFTRVTFGVICSPAHLALTLKIHLQQYKEKWIEEVAREAYVDNLLLGVSSPDELPKAYK